MFDEFFKVATGFSPPYGYQCRLANEGIRSRLIHVSTGCGKTAAAILAWLWQRINNPANTPGRLVYCLPMRVLVEQIFENAQIWVKNLAMEDKVGVHILMGGEKANDWDLDPERDSILIGTQDMLLSRALNRGYGMSRYRWPMHFGLLNNDCLWVIDEIQLMGPGLGTARQLEAFRRSATDGHEPHGVGSFFESCSATWYMSATVSLDLLATREWRNVQRPADFDLTLSDAERTQTTTPIGERRFAAKSLEIHADWHFGEAEMQDRIAEIINRHSKMVELLKSAPADLPRRTLTVCNTVERAVSVHDALRQRQQRGELQNVDLLLLHSRFRPPDRKAQMDRLKPDYLRNYPNGQIVIATQVVEAGVDISSGILWTEIAPLASLVQRLGRLNRGGEFGSNGRAAYGWTPQAIVVGIELPATQQREKREKEVAHRYLPYDQWRCESARAALTSLSGDGSPAAFESEAIEKAVSESIYRCAYSLQRHELLDFFDTDSNLSLGYTDVSPFVRGLDYDTDVYVVWRNWDGNPNDHFRWDVQRDELCGVPISRLHSFANWRKGWLWLGKERGWVSAQSQGRPLPGMTLLLPVSAGGYVSDRGWTGNDRGKPDDYYCPREELSDEELLSYLTHGWRSIPAHTDEVRAALCSLLQTLPLFSEEVKCALLTAADWHDVGKNHKAWQEAAAKALEEADIPVQPEHLPLAKFSLGDSPKLSHLVGAELRREIYRLKHRFRPGIAHEVASALALRQWHIRSAGHLRSPSPAVNGAYREQLLAEYLVMSHHGHVRKVLRDEVPTKAPREVKDATTVRGIKEGDVLPTVTINGQALGCNALSVSWRQMGRDASGCESYTRGILRLLDHYGPFRLAYLEVIFRAADARASKMASTPSPQGGSKDTRQEP